MYIGSLHWEKRWKHHEVWISGGGTIYIYIYDPICTYGG